MRALGLPRALLALSLLLSAMPAACSEAEPDPTIEFAFELVPRQPWNATGELVDAGVFCPAGSRYNIGLAFPDGSPMTHEQPGELFDAQEAGGDPAEFRAEMEYTCSDGSGSFTQLEEHGDGGIWEVIDGTGACAGMTGEGAQSYDSDPDTGEEILRGRATFHMASSDA
jgi:hypothetical protein